jgi:hypothetical protein
LYFGDATDPEFFQGKCFESAARQIIRSVHGSGQFIRDLKGDFHQTNLSRG